MKFSKMLLITDADGTLLTDDKRILSSDKVAISKFIQNGGLFTVATGRGVALARAVTDELGELLKIPAVIFNGAAVYDFNAGNFLWKCSLNKKSREYIEKIMDVFPDIGMEILIDEQIYVPRSNEYEEAHIAYGKIEPIRCRYSEIPQGEENGWVKVLFVDSPEKIDGMIEYVVANPCESIHAVRSGPMFYEFLPQGINKGVGFKKLLELTDLRDYYIIAAGDYMNDHEMLQMADLGVAVENAEDVIKESADIVVCDNNSGSIAAILEYLENLE
ncbi:MAG: HAD family hydrolase [Oscillospiraceae bacterium]|nr:HAD family hydrolase [Oscillospiraceae bacterium]